MLRKRETGEREKGGFPYLRAPMDHVPCYVKANLELPEKSGRVSVIFFPQQQLLQAHLHTCNANNHHLTCTQIRTRVKQSLPTYPQSKAGPIGLTAWGRLGLFVDPEDPSQASFSAPQFLQLPLQTAGHKTSLGEKVLLQGGSKFPSLSSSPPQRVANTQYTLAVPHTVYTLQQLCNTLQDYVKCLWIDLLCQGATDLAAGTLPGPSSLASDVLLLPPQSMTFVSLVAPLSLPSSSLLVQSRLFKAHTLPSLPSHVLPSLKKYPRHPLYQHMHSQLDLPMPSTEGPSQVLRLSDSGPAIDSKRPFSPKMAFPPSKTSTPALTIPSAFVPSITLHYRSTWQVPL